jgi:hypothetical protein
MRRTIIGGAACTPAMLRKFQETYGVSVEREHESRWEFWAF